MQFLKTLFDSALDLFLVVPIEFHISLCFLAILGIFLMIFRR